MRVLGFGTSQYDGELESEIEDKASSRLEDEEKDDIPCPEQETETETETETVLRNGSKEVATTQSRSATSASSVTAAEREPDIVETPRTSGRTSSVISQEP